MLCFDSAPSAIGDVRCMLKMVHVEDNQIDVIVPYGACIEKWELPGDMILASRIVASGNHKAAALHDHAT